MLRAFITLLRARRCQVLMKLLIVAGFVLLVFIQLKSLMNHNSPQLSLHNHRFSHHADESPFPDKQKLHAADKYEPSRTSRDHVHQRPVEAGQRPLEVGQRPLEAGQGPLGVNQKQGAVSHDGERGERGGREMSDRRHADVANEQQMSHTSKVESIQEILDEAYQAGSRNRSTQANQGGSNFNKMVTVVLMPHSHNDPGWLHTYDMYYDMRTSVMFNNLVKFLSTVDKEMPFQWSESVSLLRWYKSASESSRSILKSAIKAGTVLIDHGSWSMPDEASPTLYSLVENLIIGHTWIYNEFGVKPEFSWSNDPFGHSSTIPYLLKQCGIKAMVINRIDHLLKKKLRFDQKLEFFWKIPSNGFKREGDSMFTHILPHSLYSTSQAFGSNFTLAKLYDFSPPERQYSPIVDKDTGELLVDNATLKTRASDLANQIHMRSSYYKHNVILSPIGDDFRYIDYREFEGVYRNWNYLRDFYASHPQYNVKLKLGTLADYFNLVTEDSKDIQYPTFSGDFFPYAVESPMSILPTPFMSYWTGYFTTRPFIKVAIRRLEVMLRQTEILYSLHKLQRGLSDGPTPGLLLTDLSLARENLTWLLHHDAITGTSPSYTIQDFRNHLTVAFDKLEKFSLTVMSKLPSVQTSAQPAGALDVSREVILDTSPHVLVLPINDKQRKSITVSKNMEKRITLFNSIAHEVKTVVHIKIQSLEPGTQFQVKDASLQEVTCQVNPLFDQHSPSLIGEKEIELAFEVTLPSIGMKTYIISTRSDSKMGCSYASITMASKQYQLLVAGGNISEGHVSGFPLKPRDEEPSFRLSTKLNTIGVSSLNGKLTELATGKYKLQIHQVFGVYNQKNGGTGENGLYVFTAQDEGEVVKEDSSKTVVYAVSGPVEHTVLSILPYVVQCMKVNHVELGVSISQQVSMGRAVGDLFTRISSHLKSGDNFYTDSNSFTMMKRKRHYPDRPVAANYYPLTSAVYLQDESLRLTLLSAQSLGVASLHQGEIEVMLDRQFNTFDRGGVAEGVMDEETTLLQFRLMVEPVTLAVNDPSLPLDVIHHSLKLSHPVAGYTGLAASSLNLASVPCDYHILMLRSLDILPYGAPQKSDMNSLALVVQRFSSVGAGAVTCQQKGDKISLNLPPGYSIKRTSLSLLYPKDKLNSTVLPQLQPNSLQTYKISSVDL